MAEGTSDDPNPSHVFNRPISSVPPMMTVQCSREIGCFGALTHPLGGGVTRYLLADSR